MTRETVIAAPFTGGLRTDASYFQLALQETVAAQDLIAPNGIATQRRGWTYDGTTADAGATTLLGIARQNFVLSGQTRTNTTTSTNNPLYIHNPSSAGTSLFTASTGGVLYLPRCVYRDELIVCGQDGLRPLLRYSGAGAAGTASGGTWTAGQSVITGMAGSLAAAAVGEYAYIYTQASGATNTPPTLWARVLERNSATSATIEGVKASATIAPNFFGERAVGFAWPAVSVYNAGTLTVAANVATGTGTKWLAAVNTNVEYGDEALLVIPPAGTNAVQSYISVVNTDVSLNSNTPNITNSSYAITRRLPFRDAAAHRGSLWGAGVAQFPDRVYVSPPGWNPSLPPGFVEPYDPTAVASSANANDFLLSFVDVPSPFDGDPIVAILPSPGPLLVLKRYGVYGIFGSYPSFQVSLVPGGDGAGCADIQSAISVPEGQFWGSDLGVFTYRHGQVMELTRGRISREWRARFRAGVLNIRCAVIANHLIVQSSGADAKNYVYDLATDRWMSTLSNFGFGSFWRSKIPGEQDRLLATAGVRVANVEPVFDTANLTGNPLDANGIAPRMQATTGPALAQAAGIDGEAKLLDVMVDTNLYDASTPTTAMAVSVTHSGALENTAQRTKALGTITADTNNLAERTKFRDVNRSGRLHALSIDVTTTDSTMGRVEVPEIICSFRDARGQT